MIAVGEELLSQPLRFAGPAATGWLLALAVLAAGGALAVWLPQVAGAVTVLGTVVLGLVGVVLCLRMSLPAATPANRFMTVFYGAVTLHGHFYPAIPLRGVPQYGVFDGSVVIAGQDGALVLAVTAVQAVALLVAGAVLGTRLPVFISAAELAELAERAEDAEPAAGRQDALAERTVPQAEIRGDAADTAVAELQRIERDLHDGAQARLVALGLSLRAVQRLMPEDPEAALALVVEATETSSRALADLRDLVRGIYPPVLADRGLGDVVRALALDTPLAVATDVTLAAEPPMPVAAACYFAIAEALTNAVRHANAATVDITLAGSDGLLQATVTDDGHGGADTGDGSGLAGVERRLATFDGILALSSPPGGPTIVAIEIPYPATEILPAPDWGSGLAAFVRSSWQTRTLI